jgi:hypothetical protein
MMYKNIEIESSSIERITRSKKLEPIKKLYNKKTDQFC